MKVEPDRTMAYGFARCAHLRQVRKFSREPYANHCARVASTVAEYTQDEVVVMAAVLHDVLEDTDVTPDEMRSIFGDRVTRLVLEVTNVARPEDGNREERKRLDREHLASSSPDGATIKLADLIDNVSSVADHDRAFATVYLREKEALLEVLKHGHAGLWARAGDVLREAQEALARGG